MKRASNVLHSAQKAITGARRKSYGNAEESFGRIAALWTVYMNGEIEFTGHDVAMMMTLLKVSREKNAHAEDNLVDIAGYAALANVVGE